MGRTSKTRCDMKLFWIIQLDGIRAWRDDHGWHSADDGFITELINIALEQYTPPAYTPSRIGAEIDWLTKFFGDSFVVEFSPWVLIPPDIDLSRYDY